MPPKVLVLLGSDSDLPRMQGLVSVFEDLEIPFEMSLASAHRDPLRVADLAQGAAQRGVQVVIAAAGMAAHLAGAVAANTSLPVIGIPLSGSALSGLDSLYSTVQMPKGMPVATVGIDRGDNAAYLAAQIIALGDKDLGDRLRLAREAQREQLRQKDRRLQELGPAGYLEAGR
ncbi:MAG: 5-(carboxyamino)imidazole ribonucleotide mutase [Thermaerobacter sp.]|nr:5-(carboxyamino)imidazole ribonucleotide mutase [Thermaerobacter sp.]